MDLSGVTTADPEYSRMSDVRQILILMTVPVSILG
jgi:hypothetical protein